MYKKNILIVDDNVINRDELKKVLGAEYGILEADNGQEAIGIMKNYENNVSLVIMNLTMPGMNGHDVLRAMQSDKLLSQIPAVIDSKSKDEDMEIKCLEDGAADFITRPYKSETLLFRVRNIIKLKENTKMYEIDQLTGLYTKEYFYKVAAKFLKEHPDEKYDIIYSDIESFRSVNERYGTKVGDELLKYVAVRIKDLTGDVGIACRFASNSFVILKKRREELRQEDVNNWIQDKLADSPVKHIALKFGMYEIQSREIPVNSMCDRAMLAMQRIKHKYGVYFAKYDDSIHLQMIREEQITENMETALENEQFTVYYQPKHSVKTGGISGAEALVRWIHPEWGCVSPGEFIPLFERNGFISKLDCYVWEKVCNDIREWNRMGKKVIPVSINISRADFDQLDLMEHMEKLMNDYDLSPEFLHLEITESVYTQNPHKIIETVEQLRNAGFKIEMDDFGSGYSSLNMLSEMPIDFLKLDMQFMQKHKNQENNLSILSFIISLSKWLELLTIAEGVETEQDFQLLKSMGCNYVQGYYYAKPMPSEDFVKYMEQQIEKEEETSAGEAVATAENNEKKKQFTVLIVEDIELNREALRTMLSPYYNIQIAEDGVKALEIMRKKREEIDVVILDLMMPIMDGFKLLEIMKKESLLKLIPVIITSELGTEGELRALRLGAENSISKPYEFEILLHHIKTAIESGELRKLKARLKEE
ncbi:MAG: EAL domain-containing protein [Clostridium sp.]|nr:EAL domain-containing protein [Clostridium sp.]